MILTNTYLTDLMITHERHFWESPYFKTSANAIQYGTIRLEDPESGISEQDTSFYSKALSYFKKVSSSLSAFLNPPLIGSVVPIVCGVIPFLHHQLFEPSGILTP